MKFTENFNLNLPDLDDMADVEKLNENFQTIDTKMKSLETDPELAANVVDIKNKIGTEGDADTQPTLFGRLAQLKNVLMEKLAEMLTKVTGIDTKIGTSGDTAGTATLFGQVKDISEKMPTGAVKSVQRGVLSFNGQKVIEISEVVPEKCVVILNTLEVKDYTSKDLDSFGDGVYLVDITSTSITLKTPYNTGVSWQVVEYF